MFPRDQHNQIFLDLSQYLRAIMAQRLVMGKDGKRVAAVEVMLNTPHIAELVKKGDVISIKEAIIQSGERDIQSFDVALLDLYKQGRIELEEALRTPTRAPTWKPRSTSASSLERSRALLIGKKSPAALVPDISFVSGGKRRDFCRLLVRVATPWRPGAQNQV